uniref:Uncharacterized protein n=1 Tax=Anopheles christyi TaxID=43041 RepID=A0A182KHX7_9DIPT
MIAQTERLFILTIALHFVCACVYSEPFVSQPSTFVRN